MLGQNCYSYITIGLAIRLLRNVTNDFQRDTTIDAWEKLKESLEIGNFEVTLAAMKSNTFVDMLNNLKVIQNGTDSIGDSLAESVRNESKDIETVVFAEAITKKIYILPSRRFNTEYLLNHPEKLLSNGIFEKFDEIAKHDISSACRCLLFGEATASAFHILRATESVLKSYYYHHRKQNRLDKPMWGNMVVQLKNKPRNKPPITLLNSLDLIRSAYRNPTQHPEATYEIDSAQDLFGVCLDVIGKMGIEL